VQTQVADGPAQVEVEDARLHPCDPLVLVDLEDLVEVRGDDDHGAPDRCRTARQAGAAAARDEGAIVTRRDRDRRGDVLGARREAHHRGLAAYHAGVTAVERKLEWLGASAVGAERCLEVVEQRAVVAVVFSYASVGDCPRLPTPLSTLAAFAPAASTGSIDPRGSA
jgi:hypothetical protein